jgi:fimbrial chaperone protein
MEKSTALSLGFQDGGFLNMRASIVGALICLIYLEFAATTSSQAASLQVAPVGIEVMAPAAAATLSLRNKSTAPLNAQIRVFRWTEEAGEEKLVPTDAVVASPPMTTLAPGVDYTVRLVRLAKEPVTGGESYRLLVDELPTPGAQQNHSVTLVIRYSIPVFFYSNDSAGGRVAWSLDNRNGHDYIVAENTGDRHVRISALAVRGAGGKSISFGAGLTGYVLGRSTMRWALPGKAAHLGADKHAIITAQTNLGPMNASPSPRPSR